MSAGGDESKTEQPTSKKIRDAREKGQVAQSKELTMASSIISILLCLGIGYRYGIQLFTNNVQAIMHQIATDRLYWHSIKEECINSIQLAIKIVALPIMLGTVISLLVNILQTSGFVISKEAFKFDITKLNPVSNFQSIFSKKTFIKFFKNIAEISTMTVITTSIFRKSLVEIVNVYYYSLPNIIFFWVVVIAKIFIILLSVHVIFAIMDFILEKRSLNKQLMMSLQEIKDEDKNTNGNPEIKHKRRELHQELLEDDGYDGLLSNASLVLSNPTHIAIVIMYKPSRFKFPILLCKANGGKAQQIFRGAKRKNIPIIRDIWLARQLYALAEVGKFIPISLLKPLADIIGKNIHLIKGLTKEIELMKSSKIINPTKGPSNGNKNHNRITR